MAGDALIVGWDIGGAHVKACRWRAGELLDAAQWPCPLWQGLDKLEQAMAQAQTRWRDLHRARHAVTMTGEMADNFADREQGVRAIAGLLAQGLVAAGASSSTGTLRFYAGDSGWCDAEAVPRLWPQIASANWLASANLAARSWHRLQAGTQDDGAVLVDIGSTTTDLIALRGGTVLTRSRNDAQRLASGELVYHGVVRTPLCALARRIPWRGQELNVMNEFFATTADVYRLCGEIDAAHDQQPTADGAGRDAEATRRRLARMIGLDAREGSDAEWLAFARAWRAAQVTELRGQLQRVRQLHALPDGAALIAAGCGAFLVPELAGITAPVLSYSTTLVPVAPSAPAGTAAWAQVCAPSVAVAALLEQDAA